MSRSTKAFFSSPRGRRETGRRPEGWRRSWPGVETDLFASSTGTVACLSRGLARPQKIAYLSATLVLGHRPPMPPRSPALV
jgi:hypothetical protein